MPAQVPRGDAGGARCGSRRTGGGGRNEVERQGAERNLANWLTAFGTLLGGLAHFTALVMFLPAFWRS